MYSSAYFYPGFSFPSAHTRTYSIPAHDASGSYIPLFQK